MPRLELLACCVGARLANSIRNLLDIPDLKITYWSDSMVALHWIKNNGEWSIFVSNRITEIARISSPENWRHVLRRMNPADVLSRGCSPRHLLESKWFGGPEWLLGDAVTWPTNEIQCETKVLDCERRKIKLCNLNVTDKRETWYSIKFFNYHSIIRMTAWVLRFLSNCRRQSKNRNLEELSTSKIEKAENTLISTVQKEYFPENNNIPHIKTFADNEGLIRVRTRITERKDDFNFLSPILLPNDCILTRRLIEYYHRKNCHAGTQMLVSILREKFWILRARRTVRNIIQNCVKCKRYNTEPVKSESVYLPADRVRDAGVFEVIGIDLAGPLFLKNGEKVWVVLYTCAVYRAVHLELVTALSTNNFLLSLRRFIARRGRHSVVYTDNGTNFRGAVWEFKNLDWIKIEWETEIQCIKWKFNPPTAAWWERLIRVLKDLLKRTLGNAVLMYEELLTILCDCESIVNSRPLTYVSEDSDDLIPLTPAMFMMSNASLDVTDLDLSDFASNL
ncbi:putative RNA-directed DNA polymerase from transposon X-element [Trichonephila clavipes]|nr:putative RNA-directed DNA polymerase from transposon X-element [Trichonephila clavipes]